MPLNLNYEVLKEPRGFIKFIQIFIAICAFAVICNFTTSVHVSIKCTINKTVYENFTFSYPFQLHDYTVHRCNETTDKLCGEPATSVQFFVFTGVIVFLYCLVAIIGYILCSGLYENDLRVPKMDFAISSLIAIFWFIASAAWTDGVLQLKRYTDPHRIIDQATTILDRKNSTVLIAPTYGGVNISLMFGFLNVAVWASSLWFLWKETEWSRRNDPLMDTGSAPVPDGSSI